jgi:methyltransferase
VSGAALLVGLVALERCSELIYAARNTRRLFAAGAVEHGAAHYPLIVLLHAAWLMAVFAFAPRDQAPIWFWLIVYLLLQGVRLWVIASLGSYWTTRIIRLPGAPLVQRGPYRFLRHPNYLVVIGEIAVLPLVFSEYRVALLFSALNLALLAWRVRVENTALARAMPKRARSARSCSRPGLR